MANAPRPSSADPRCTGGRHVSVCTTTIAAAPHPRRRRHHKHQRRAQREREEPWRLGAQGAAARAAITSGSTVAMFDSGDPERAGVSGRHAVKHAASGRPYRRVVSDAFSL